MTRRRSTAAYLTRRRWTDDDARAALAAWEASEMPMAAFAQHEGLDVQRLYRWRRQLAHVSKGSRAAEFVELRPRAIEHVELRPRAVEHVVVVLRSGRVLRVSETIQPSLLSRLASALEDPSAC